MDSHAKATEQTLLADRFDELWRASETAPDAFAFLEAQTAVAPRECVEVLLVDQAHRCRTGHPIPAERYLEEFPEIASDPELKLDLVCGEFYHARRGRGDRPDVAPFIARFPELREALIRQAEVHDWWARAALSETTGGEDPGHRSQSYSSGGQAMTASQVGASPPTRPPASELVPGLVLGDYQLQDQIGRGGMGAVYRAVHLRLGREVALKVIVPLCVSSDQVASRFYREMKAVGKLDHPHLVRATDARQVGDRLLLVMELLEGIDLGRLVARVGPLSVADACEMTRQAAEGLEHAHQHGIVHRDVKPSNLMLARGGTIKVLDLGLARLQEEVADGITPSQLAMGTPDYMAPEQAADPRAVTPRSDVYSLGCTLYHLLAGQPPFHDSGSPFRKLLGHQQAPIPPLGPRRPDLPEGLAGLVDRLLAKDPAARPASARAVAEDLRPWCLGANLPGLLDRALRANPPAEKRRALAGHTTTDPAEGSAQPLDLPSTVAPPRGNEAPQAEPASTPASRRARPGRRSLLALAIAAGMLLGLPITWRFLRTGPPALPSPRVSAPERPLTITALAVRHYRAQGADFQYLGPIDSGGPSVQVRDDVRVELVLSEPAYAYLVALNTDGSVQVVLPERDDQAPPRADRLVLYPDRKDYFTLTEGPGVQAFVAIASRRPLPAARAWGLDPAALHWMRAEGAGVWRYDGEQFASNLSAGPGPGIGLGGTRGTKTRRVPEPFVQACQALRGRPGVDAVGAVAFPVLPSPAKVQSP
jgi:serine/threonine protein kinase